MNKKIAILVGVILLVVVFYTSGLNDYLSFEYLKNSQEAIAQYTRENPVFSALAFFVVYVVVTAVSLPGAALLTLAGGAIFGLFWGLLLVSFASSIGATLAFLMARFLFQESVERQFKTRLKAIHQGIEKEGAFYLFSLRLVPVFPFFVINLVMGLTKLPIKTFYWVSQLAMLPGTFVYVNAGTQLSQIHSLSGLVSPAILISFAVLGLFPLIAKKVLEGVKAQKVYEGWKKPKVFDQNMIVIGAGAGGLVSSYIAAAVKAKVTLVEAKAMGGDCLNTGCVPSKALIQSAKVAHTIRKSKSFGILTENTQVDFPVVMKRLRSVIQAIEPHDSIERYTALGVNVIEGYAKLIDPWTVEIQTNAGETKRLTAQNIVLATGAEPLVPPIPGLEASGYLTSDTLWEAFEKRLTTPNRVIVLGGGPIGSELAQAMQRLGADVTLVERADAILSREDREISLAATEALADSGVTVKTSTEAKAFHQREGRKLLECVSEGKTIEIEYDDVIIALGRKARLGGYGLETLGIETNRVIETNDYLETKFPNIFAVGDVVGPYQFTHVAAYQAWFAAVNGLFGVFKKFKIDYRVIPWTTFIDPEVARVGLNEIEAQEQGIEYEVVRYGLEDLDRAIADGSDEGVVKVLTRPGKDTILGVTIFGRHAGDLLAEFVLAMKYNLGLNKILGTIHTYPTLSEANKYVAGEWKKAHVSPRTLRILAHFHRYRRGASQNES